MPVVLRSSRCRIPGRHHGFDVNVVDRNDTNLCRRRRRRIKRLVGVEKIVERIPHRLEDEGRRVMLCAVEVLRRKLSRSRDNPIVHPALLEPPGIEPKGVGAGHPARTGDRSQVGSEIAAALPHRSRVKVQPVTMTQLAEVDVHRAADADAVLHRKPFGRIALDVPKRVADVLQVKDAPNSSS